MKKTLLVSAIAATLSLAGCQSTNGSSSVEPESTSHISQNVYEVEFNAAQAFVTQTTKLEQSLTEYCASQMKGDAQIKQQWHQTMLAWMALQGQERGPATALEQSWNVQFLPDKKNTTGRKMSVLTKSDQIWSAEDISTQSVTVQGLGALEWLLYDKASSLSTNSNTCATSVAIAENLNNKASIIADSWAQNPWKSLDMTEWESEYISLLSNQLEYSMKKLSRPLPK